MFCSKLGFVVAKHVAAFEETHVVFGSRQRSGRRGSDRGVDDDAGVHEPATDCGTAASSAGERSSISAIRIIADPCGVTCAMAHRQS